MANLPPIFQNEANKETKINQNFDSVSLAGRFGRKSPNAVGLTFFCFGGEYYKTSTKTIINIPDLSVACIASTNTSPLTNYIFYNEITNTLNVNTTGFIDIETNVRVAQVTTNQSNIISYTDKRVMLSSTGGGSVLPIFGDITITSNNTATPNFTVSGGLYFQNGGVVSNAKQKTISSLNYTTAFQVGQTYYVYLDLNENNIKVTVNNASYTLTTNGKLLYVISAGASTYTVTDYRAQNIFMYNKTLYRQIELNNTDKTYTFSLGTPLFGQIATDEYTSFTTKGTFARANPMLLVKNANHGHDVGTTLNYSTGNGTKVAKPWAITSNGNVEVYFGSDLNIWSKTTNAVDTAIMSDFYLVLTVDIEVR